jgi:hypothetical protein
VISPVVVKSHLVRDVEVISDVVEIGDEAIMDAIIA